MVGAASNVMSIGQHHIPLVYTDTMYIRMYIRMYVHSHTYTYRTHFDLRGMVQMCSQVCTFGLLLSLVCIISQWAKLPAYVRTYVLL